LKYLNHGRWNKIGRIKVQRFGAWRDEIYDARNAIPSIEDIKGAEILKKRSAQARLSKKISRTSGGLLNRRFLLRALICCTSSGTRSKVMQSRFSTRRFGLDDLGMTARPR
jgi:hypothetical protein